MKLRIICHIALILVQAELFKVSKCKPSSVTIAESGCRWEGDLRATWKQLSYTPGVYVQTIYYVLDSY